MNQMETIAEKVTFLLKANMILCEEKCILKKKRTISIHDGHVCINCQLNHHMSFERLQENGFAFNQAEILLLPEEFPTFAYALQDHQLPFPSTYRQSQGNHPHLIVFFIESIEPPDQFAERLSTALHTLEQCSTSHLS
ncbi:DUF1259 domain-containing protein [Planomicrobium sp. CPCC 101110]|uniref:DUF1259 domain-containing protein n=1 Tax=Planomicrobium sp. CPCC 101110 TaxID=2599619 RepID=UPI001646DBB9|nr:DUF1259 domain-containing protein [Planomicrobium sp. CPCC 101110]